MIPIQDSIPRRTAPIVTWIIILINVLVFLYETALPEQLLRTFVDTFGVVPRRYTDPAWYVEGISYWPFFTSMFLHGGWTHLIGNMWTLWIFGDNVEDRMGKSRFIVFYLLCGIAASVTHVIFNMNSPIPSIGASGAIAGVMGAYFTMFPHSRIITLVPIFFWPFFFEIPAFFFLGFWFMSQLFSGTFAIMAPQIGGGIAWWAHIGGFIAGILLLPVFRRNHYRNFYPDEWVWLREFNRY